MEEEKEKKGGIRREQDTKGRGKTKDDVVKVGRNRGYGKRKKVETKKSFSTSLVDTDPGHRSTFSGHA